MKKITIFDTFGFLFRSFYALPPLKSKDGFPTGMITGFMNFIVNIGKDFDTHYLVFALDSEGESFRNDIYKEYKANRKPAPPDLKKQLPIVIELIEKMGFSAILKEKCEADDIIASLSKIAKEKDYIVQIVSHDKDLYQLMDDNITFFDPIKRAFTLKKDVIEKYGIEPKNFVDFQALLGDSIDNIPGVRGIGQKSAAKLINKFKTIEALYDNIDKIENKRWQKLLLENKQNAFISKKLATLDKDCLNEEMLDFEKFKLPTINPVLKVVDILKKYDLNNIIKRVEKDGLYFKTSLPKEYKKQEDKKFKFILLQEEKKVFEILNQIPKDSVVAFDTETTGLNSLEAKIVGFSFCYEKNCAYYIPINHFYLGVGEQVSLESAKKIIQKLNQFNLIAHNFKYDYQIIKKNFNINLNIFADTMLQAWIFDPSSLLSLDNLAKNYFDYEMIKYKEIAKNKKDFSEVDLESAAKYGAEDALICRKLYFNFLNLLDKKILNLLDKIEYPFIKTLSYMEENGIKVDVNYLNGLKKQFELTLKKLTNDIYILADEQFNINSTKQLGVILFEKLKLKPIKKTKTGYSTNEDVLKKLIQEHPIIEKLLEFRELSKLQSTYIEPILKLAKTNDRIHTSFLQTGTSTGRLSSKNPNLQNIPVRKNEGKKIREAFIARDEFKLVSIDYSQIELRLLAHFSKDEKLLKAFKNDEDIHLKTAYELFKNDAKEKRNIAKSINFGLIYGMGARKLAETLNLKSNEAKNYIEHYFKAFPTIKTYLDSIKEFVRENGYVETLLSRVRKFDFTNVNAKVEANYLREATNTVFQGSAADIIKLAMLKIHDIFGNNDEVKLLLQIHDELIFEIKEDKVEQYSKELKDIMENIIELNVALKVNISVGDNWGELEKN